MAVLVLDPYVEKRLRAKRDEWDIARFDEVWDSVYTIMPSRDNEHQELIAELAPVLMEVVDQPRLGWAYCGVYVSDRGEDWEQDYRNPDVAVFLPNGAAVNCDTHWRGAADFLVEIITPGDRTREKIPFYSSLGVVELLIVDRDPWTLELYRHQDGQLTKVGQSTLAAPDVLTSQSVGLTFQLLPGESRPQIQVTHPATGREWKI